MTILFVSAILLASALAFWSLLDVIVLALSLAVIVMPIHRYFSNGVKESWSAIAITVLIFIVVFGTLVFTLAVLYQNSSYLSDMITTIIGWIKSIHFESLGLPFDIDNINGLISGNSVDMLGYISGYATGFPMLVVKAIVFFLTLYMFILKGDIIWKGIISCLPEKICGVVHRMAGMSTDTLYAIYVVHISTSFITFFLALPFFYLLGYEHVLFYSVMAAIFQLIPIIGPSVLMAFLTVYAISTGDYRSAALLAFIGYPIVCALPDLYFRPVMMGKRASIHPVIMWIGFFGGLAVMGIVGFILGPLFLALMVSGYGVLIEELKIVNPGEIFPRS